MSVLTESGRIAIAAAIKEQSIHLAWGTGDVNWGDTPPVEDVTATVLLAEVGRRHIFEKRFCSPDVNGEIIVPTGRFTFSNNPTNNLYLSFKFDFDDGSDKVIRELGVISGSEIKSTVPAGQMYFLPADIETAGILLLLEYTAPIHRNAATRETFEFVITF